MNRDNMVGRVAPLAPLAPLGTQISKCSRKPLFKRYFEKTVPEGAKVPPRCQPFRSYLMAYASHAHKDIFNVHELDLQGVATAFGFSVPPRVDLNFSPKGQRARNSGKGGKQGRGGAKEKVSNGHAFSADNPYGKKAAGDKRQFQH